MDQWPRKFRKGGVTAKSNELPGDCRQEMVFIEQSFDGLLSREEADGYLLRIEEIEMGLSGWAAMEGGAEFAAREAVGCDRA